MPNRLNPLFQRVFFRLNRALLLGDRLNRLLPSPGIGPALALALYQSAKGRQYQ